MIISIKNIDDVSSQLQTGVIKMKMLLIIVAVLVCAGAAQDARIAVLEREMIVYDSLYQWHDYYYSHRYAISKEEMSNFHTESYAVDLRLDACLKRMGQIAKDIHMVNGAEKTKEIITDALSRVVAKARKTRKSGMFWYNSGGDVWQIDLSKKNK